MLESFERGEVLVLEKCFEGGILLHPASQIFFRYHSALIVVGSFHAAHAA